MLDERASVRALAAAADFTRRNISSLLGELFYSLLSGGQGWGETVRGVDWGTE